MQFWLAAMQGSLAPRGDVSTQPMTWACMEMGETDFYTVAICDGSSFVIYVWQHYLEHMSLGVISRLRLLSVYILGGKIFQG